MSETDYVSDELIVSIIETCKILVNSVSIKSDVLRRMAIEIQERREEAKNERN